MKNPMNSEYFAPWAQGRRIKAIVGHYGSGKTEIALNMALEAKALGLGSVIVDMDIVNPFFRSAEQHELLRRRGVELIHPPFALSGVDLPVLPPDINRVFADDKLHAILDIGGEDSGAAALGGYKRFFDQEPIDLYYVVNVFRPFSSSVDQIVSLMQRIERRARTLPTGLINNANLGDFTEPAHLLEAHSLLEKVSEQTGIPILCATGSANVLKTLPDDYPSPLYPIERYLKPEWMED